MAGQLRRNGLHIYKTRGRNRGQMKTGNKLFKISIHQREIQFKKKKIFTAIRLAKMHIISSVPQGIAVGQTE